MKILTIKLKNNTIIAGKQPMHHVLADEFGIDFDDVLDIGYIDETGKEVWYGEKKIGERHRN